MNICLISTAKLVALHGFYNTINKVYFYGFSFKLQWACVSVFSIVCHYLSHFAHVYTYEVGANKYPVYAAVLFFFF